jgi:hypothetical protein
MTNAAHRNPAQNAERRSALAGARAIVQRRSNARRTGEYPVYSLVCEGCNIAFFAFLLSGIGLSPKEPETS